MFLIKGVKKQIFSTDPTGWRTEFAFKIGRQISFWLLQLNIFIAGLLF